jgi:hybrid cluster-associated redox disulfide protein
MFVMSFRVTGETIIGDILDANADSAPFFLEMGMHCLGCPSARGESLAEACEVHGVDASEMAGKLNAFFEGARTA